MATSEPIYLRGDRCDAAPEIAYPNEGCVLDLRGHRAGDAGTCGSERAAGSVAELVGAPIAVTRASLPMLVQLPEGRTDATCDALCRGRGAPAPTFGVRLRFDARVDERWLTVRVEAPWSSVAGDEGSPSLCLDGYPSVLEFGQPLACVYTFGDEIDLVTTSLNPPPARVVIDQLDAGNQLTGCCMYPRD